MIVAMRALRGAGARSCAASPTRFCARRSRLAPRGAQARVKAGRALDADDEARRTRRRCKRHETRRTSLARQRGCARRRRRRRGDREEPARRVEGGARVLQARAREPGRARRSCSATRSTGGRAHWRGLREMVLAARADGARGHRAARAAAGMRCDRSNSKSRVFWSWRRTRSCWRRRGRAGGRGCERRTESDETQVVGSRNNADRSIIVSVEQQSTTGSAIWARSLFASPHFHGSPMTLCDGSSCSCSSLGSTLNWSTSCLNLGSSAPLSPSSRISARNPRWRGRTRTAARSSTRRAASARAT